MTPGDLHAPKHGTTPGTTGGHEELPGQRSICVTSIPVESLSKRLSKPLLQVSRSGIGLPRHSAVPNGTTSRMIRSFGIRLNQAQPP